MSLRQEPREWESMFDTNEDPASAGQSMPFMKRVGLAALGVAMFLGYHHFNGPSSAMAGWGGNWDTAVAQSRSTGKPAVVLFTADWCPACRQFESETLSRADVKQ